MKAYHPTILCFAAALLAPGAAHAETAGAGNDAGPIASAQVSLADAIAAAEKHAGGKAARAEYEKGKGGQWAYDVEVVAGAKTFDVKVDAEKGAVIASVEDKADKDDDGDEAD